MLSGTIHGPNIPVRVNRSIVLRQMLASRRGDLSVMVRPQKAEASPHVMGLNKAVTRELNRHLQGWFREQTMILDKMNRHQNSAYENLLRLQKRKELLLVQMKKAREEKRQRDESRNTTNSETKVNKTSEDNENKEQSAENHDHKDDVDSGRKVHNEVRSNQGHDTLKEERSGERAQSSHTQGAGESLPEGRPSISHGQNNNVPQSREVLDAKIFKLTQSKLNVTESKEPTEGQNPSNQLVLPQTLDGKEMGNEVCMYPLLKPHTSPRINMTTPHKKSQSSGDLNHPQTAPSYVLRSSPRLIRSRTLPAIVSRSNKDPVPGEDFTCYRRERTGKITPAEIPYRRRKFESPRRVDPKIQEGMMKSEEMMRSNNKDKFQMFTKELEDLEEWNPLEEVRRLFPEFYRNPYESNDQDQEDKYGGLSISMRHMMQAFGGTEQHFLQNLDPNSPEALKMCRYLRKQDGATKAGSGQVADDKSVVLPVIGEGTDGRRRHPSRGRPK